MLHFIIKLYSEQSSILFDQLQIYFPLKTVNVSLFLNYHKEGRFQKACLDYPTVSHKLGVPTVINICFKTKLYHGLN